MVDARDQRNSRKYEAVITLTYTEETGSIQEVEKDVMHKPTQSGVAKPSKSPHGYRQNSTGRMSKEKNSSPTASMQ
jgi:hypothetical protein